MSNEEHVEFIDEKKQEKTKKRGSVRDFLDGSMLTSGAIVKQLPFILFLSLLALVYIGNRYNTEKITRATIILQQEVKRLRAEMISSESNLMFMSKQSEVIRLVKANNLGLNEAVEPPYKLVIKE